MDIALPDALHRAGRGGMDTALVVVESLGAEVVDAPGVAAVDGGGVDTRRMPMNRGRRRHLSRMRRLICERILRDFRMK